MSKCARPISITAAARPCGQPAEKTSPVGIPHIAPGWTAMVTASPASRRVAAIDPLCAKSGSSLGSVKRTFSDAKMSYSETIPMTGAPASSRPCAHALKREGSQIVRESFLVRSEASAGLPHGRLQEPRPIFAMTSDLGVAKQSLLASSASRCSWDIRTVEKYGTP